MKLQVKTFCMAGAVCAAVAVSCNEDKPAADGNSNDNSPRITTITAQVENGNAYTDVDSVFFDMWHKARAKYYPNGDTSFAIILPDVPAKYLTAISDDVNWSEIEYISDPQAKIFLNEDNGGIDEFGVTGINRNGEVVAYFEMEIVELKEKYEGYKLDDIGAIYSDRDVVINTDGDVINGTKTEFNLKRGWNIVYFLYKRINGEVSSGISTTEDPAKQWKWVRLNYESN